MEQASEMRKRHVDRQTDGQTDKQTDKQGPRTQIGTWASRQADPAQIRYKGEKP